MASASPTVESTYGTGASAMLSALTVTAVPKAHNSLPTGCPGRRDQASAARATKLQPITTASTGTARPPFGTCEAPGASDSTATPATTAGEAASSRCGTGLTGRPYAHRGVGTTAPPVSTAPHRQRATPLGPSVHDLHP